MPTHRLIYGNMRYVIVNNKLKKHMCANIDAELKSVGDTKQDGSVLTWPRLDWWNNCSKPES